MTLHLGFHQELVSDVSTRDLFTRSDQLSYTLAVTTVTPVNGESRPLTGVRGRHEYCDTQVKPRDYGYL